MLIRARFAHSFGLIRTRLALLIILILASGLLAFIVTTLTIAQHLLNNSNEKRLMQDVTSLAAALATDATPDPVTVRNQLSAFSSSEIFLQYQDQQGGVIASSANVEGAPLPFAQMQPAIANGQFTQTTVDRKSFVIYGQAIVVQGQVRGYVIAAYAVDGETETLIFTLMYSGVCIMLTLTALLVWLLVRRMLRPLEQLAHSASRIAKARDHSLRVRVQGQPNEITSLGRTINGMLQALELAYQDTQKVNELQRRFLADVSHELRTPLTIMLSSLELVEKEQGSDPEFQTNALKNIHIEAQRMARLVTRLLMLARTDGSVPFAREPLLIIDILNEAHQQSFPLDRELRLECSGLENLDDAAVSGNADYLKQVFLIVLENAYKYTPAGGKITLSGERRGQELSIAIADTGIGIAEEDIPRLFERFYRARNTRELPGMGLGLSIAQSILAQHDGTISVKSISGQGSCFTICLPLLNR